MRFFRFEFEMRQLGYFFGNAILVNHLKLSIRGAVHSLGQVQLECRKEIKLAQQLQKEYSVAGLRLLNLFILE